MGAVLAMQLSISIFACAPSAAAALLAEAAILLPASLASLTALVTAFWASAAVLAAASRPLPASTMFCIMRLRVWSHDAACRALAVGDEARKSFN